MKKNTHIIKKFIVAFVTAGVILNCGIVTSFAAQTLYEEVTTSKVVKGVTYDNKHRLTDDGWLDLHIITIDLNNSNISVSPVLSKKETGLRETVSNLLEKNGAVAGVNSAYFGLTGNYSSAFGPHISGNNIISMDADKNLEKNQFGTYFTDENGTPYFEYFKTGMEFLADGKSHFEIAGVNTITQMVYPVYIDKNAMSDTKKLDERFKEITKIVVENNRIIKISEKGETVSIPNDGYIIAISAGYANTYLKEFSVGQTAEFKINTVFDTQRIETAISGGGIILKNGEKPYDYGEMASKRQPRTLLGVSQDGGTMKLIVAEGQRSGGSNSSIGLDVDESIALLKNEGMYNGLNLDGGGSSLMAIKASDKDNVSSVSDPAESKERPVVAAVGVFDSSEKGEIKEVIIKPSSDVVLAGNTITLEAFGYDENYHKIPIAAEDISFNCDENIGTINKNRFSAKVSGTAFITASYKDLVANTSIHVADVGSIVTDKKELKLRVGQSVEIKAEGLTTDGYSVNLGSKIEFSTDIGTMNGNTFTATKDGGGYIKCAYNGLETYIKVSVGTTDTAITSFEDVKYPEFSAFPNDISGIAGISSANASDGAKGLGLSYYFKESDATQAAYLNFSKPIPISGSPVALKLDVKGNGTGQWVRGKIVDATGAEMAIDFSRNVNWTDWKTMSADIPTEAVYPISLKTVYVAALTNKNTEQQAMYFDNLRAQIPVNVNVELPADVKKNDLTQSNTSGKENGYTYFNFTGNVTGNVSDKAMYTNARVSVNNALGTDSDFAVFGGKTDISAGNKAQTVKWQEGYKVYENNGATLINMFAKNGGLRNTQKSQWTTFKNDAINTKNKNVIIFMDNGPDAFKDAEEAKLFRSALKEVSGSGKNVFVLYANTQTYSSVLKEGVRYISLPNLWTSAGKLNDEYRIVRFKANADTLTFEALDIF